MREKNTRSSYNNSTVRFTPRNKVTTIQSLYDWSIPSEERRTLLDAQRSF